LAAIFGFFALASFIFAILKNRPWGAFTMACTFVNMSCAICAFSVSIFYPTRSRPAVDTPGFSFILMCVGAMSSLIILMLSFYGMRYKSGLLHVESMESTESMGGVVPAEPKAPPGEKQASTCSKEIWRASGKACIIAAGVLILLGVVMEFVAIFGPWWTDTHTHSIGEGSAKLVAEIDVTLWKVHVISKHGKFEDVVLDWAEYCGENYVNDESWCHKIRAVRATTILAVIFGFFSVILLARAWAANKRGLGTCAVLFNFVGMICAICSFSVSIFYPTSTRPSVDFPGFAFVLVCVSALFSLIATLLASYGLWYSSNLGFKTMESSGRESNGLDKEDGDRSDTPVYWDTTPSPESYGSPNRDHVLTAL